MVPERGSEAAQSEMKVKRNHLPFGEAIAEVYEPWAWPTSSPFHCHLPKQQGLGVTHFKHATCSLIGRSTTEAQVILQNFCHTQL